MAAATTAEMESLKKLFNPDSQEWLKSPKENNSLLEEWLSTPMTEDKITTAAPIIATTITLEAIQNLLYSNGYPVAEGEGYMDFGPFEDSQFDAVVDVKTSGLHGKHAQKEEEDSLLCDVSDDSIPECSDLSEDDFSLLPGMVISDSDLDLSYDSGIEAEIDDLQEEKNTQSDKVERNERKRKRSHTEMDECCQAKQSKRIYKKTKSENDDNDQDLPKAKCQFLWEFLHHLLVSKRYEQCIAWKNPHKGIFRMVDHNMVAKLWGKQKRRKNMTYDKLSRALRYYYAKNILAKVNGQRLTYKFCRDPNGRKYAS